MEERQVEQPNKKEQLDKPTKLEAPVKVPRFTDGTSAFVQGIARTTKVDFMSTFDDGLPISHKDSDGQSEVIMLYNTKEALPANQDIAARFHDGSAPPMLSATDATANCDSLKVVVMGKHYDDLHECIALVGHNPSHHIQKWMRIDENENLGRNNTLVPVGRTTGKRRRNSVSGTYTVEAVEKLWEFLLSYLSRIEELKSRLKPILEGIAINNTVVVMTCNLGQADMLLNFACHSRATGMDVKNVLVFATDEETIKIAKGSGFTTFYDEKVRLVSHDTYSIPKSPGFLTLSN